MLKRLFISIFLLIISILPYHSIQLSADTTTLVATSSGVLYRLDPTSSWSTLVSSDGTNADAGSVVNKWYQYNNSGTQNYTELGRGYVQFTFPNQTPVYIPSLTLTLNNYAVHSSIVSAGVTSITIKIYTIDAGGSITSDDFDNTATLWSTSTTITSANIGQVVTFYPNSGTMLTPNASNQLTFITKVSYDYNVSAPPTIADTTWRSAIITFEAYNNATISKRPTLSYSTSATTPETPSNLTAEWDYGPHGLYINNYAPSLTWDGSSIGVLYYDLQIADNESFTGNNVGTSYWAGNLPQPAIVLFPVDNSNNVVAWGLWETETLYFRVRAANSYGVGDWSNIASLPFDISLASLIPPVHNFTATFQMTETMLSDGQLHDIGTVLLEWDNYPQPEGQTGFYIERATNETFTQNRFVVIDLSFSTPVLWTSFANDWTALLDFFEPTQYGATTLYYRIMVKNNSTFVDQEYTTGLVSLPVVYGSYWTTTSVEITQQNVDDAEAGYIIPTPTTTPPNPFPIDFDFDADWFPYVALIVTMLLCFILPTVISKGSNTGMFIGVATAGADLALFTVMGWVGFVPIVVVTAVTIIYIVLRNGMPLGGTPT